MSENGITKWEITRAVIHFSIYTLAVIMLLVGYFVILPEQLGIR